MASADRSTLFINATVLDGSEHMEPQPDMAVAVERGVITWMGPSAVAQAPAGLRGCHQVRPVQARQHLRRRRQRRRWSRLSSESCCASVRV